MSADVCNFEIVGLNILVAVNYLLPDPIVRLVLQYTTDVCTTDVRQYKNVIWSVVYTEYFEDSRQTPRLIGTFLSHCSAIRAALKHIDPLRLSGFDWPIGVPKIIDDIWDDDVIIREDGTKMRERIQGLDLGRALELLTAIENHEWQSHDLHSSFVYHIFPSTPAC